MTLPTAALDLTIPLLPAQALVSITPPPIFEIENVANAWVCPGVAFYSYFKSNCPNAYAYAFDESSGTALWTCDSALAADYTVTFCP